MRIYTKSFAALVLLRSAEGYWSTISSSNVASSEHTDNRSKLRRGATGGRRILEESEPCIKTNGNGTVDGDGTVDADFIFGGGGSNGKGKGKGGKGNSDSGKGKGKGKDGRRQRRLNSENSDEKAVKADLAGDSEAKSKSEKRKQSKATQIVMDQSEGRVEANRLKADTVESSSKSEKMGSTSKSDKVESKEESITESDVLCADSSEEEFVEQSSPDILPTSSPDISGSPVAPPMIAVTPPSQVPVVVNQVVSNGNGPVSQPILIGNPAPNPGPVPIVSDPIPAPAPVPTPVMFAPFAQPTIQPVTAPIVFAPFVQPTIEPAPAPIMFAPFIMPTQILPPPFPSTTPVLAPVSAITEPLATSEPVFENSDGIVIPLVPELVTSAPTSDPTKVKTCNDAFVYCPGRSTCLEGGLGWSIDLNTDLALTILADCEIYAGVQGCDMTTGTKVGMATISRDTFHMCLDVGEYESNTFHLYAGQCVSNDAGAQLRNGGVCNEELMQTHSGDFQSFTYVYEGGPAIDQFTFDASHPVNVNFWSGFVGFPIGTATSEFVVGHVKACPVGALESDPLFVQQATWPPVVTPSSRPTSAPTNGPTLEPTISPTSRPSAAPSLEPSAAPTLGPTTSPTLGPTTAPTLEPSSAPSSVPTSIPTTTPTAGPSEIPTGQPTAYPSARPSTVPTETPTAKPSSHPSKSPSVLPTSFPSMAPSSSPTISATIRPSIAPRFPSSIPTKVPTRTPSFVIDLTSSVNDVTTATPTQTDLFLANEETASPTQLPFIPKTKTVQCNSAYVYCPGMSDCFSDVYGDSSARGWSIEYTGGVVEDCQIYIGVGEGCSMENAQQVGTFSLTRTTAHFCLDRNVYQSKSFQFYAGKCRTNDAGAHLRRGDECNESDQMVYGERWDTYPLQLERDSYTDTFVFDPSMTSQGDYWTELYSVFDIGGPLRRFLSGHVDVCTVSPADSPVSQSLSEATTTLLPTISPSAAPTKETEAPTALPSSAPTPKPTFRLFLSPFTPSPTATSFQQAGDFQTLQPIPASSVAPSPTTISTTLTPSSVLTKIPLSLPTPRPTYRFFLPPVTPSPTAHSFQQEGNFQSVQPVSPVAQSIDENQSTRIPTIVPVTAPTIETETLTLLPVSVPTPRPTFRFFFSSPSPSPTSIPFQQDSAFQTSDPAFAPDAGSSIVVVPVPTAPTATEPTAGPIHSNSAESIKQPSRAPTFRVFFFPTSNSPTQQLMNEEAIATERPTPESIHGNSNNSTEPGLQEEGALDVQQPTPPPTYHVYIPNAPHVTPQPPVYIIDLESNEDDATYTESPTYAPDSNDVAPAYKYSGESTVTILTPSGTMVPLPANAIPAASEASCEPAWVYCPGRSTCLNDPAFNDGKVSAYDNDGSHRVWGWSIEYDPNVDGYVDDCVILIGGNDCDLNKAQQVGTFTVRENFAHFCLDESGYTSNEYGLYAGKCKGNDAGGSIISGSCDAEEVAWNAARPHNFPFYTNDGPMTNYFTVESSDPINKTFGPTNHEVFPLQEMSYISAYTCVMKSDTQFVEQGQQAEEHQRFHWQWGWGNGFLYSSHTSDGNSHD